ncbi:FecR family protein [Chitinophaga qingshengii]|uniref:FecR domain-containing protein n=1 Tax=Chitinophaga qingshengii TaxID=1569794 RepID=A0ABR7TWD6_9BACT|nr:FecR domain-containing protein [Chitinophaga qingshengii]MBC9934789.1 FecR domain-containing protein [Chitinophaga qingshengii]
MPAIDELITHFIQSPHDPVLQETIAVLVAESPEKARYVEEKLEAWLTVAQLPVTPATTVKTSSTPSLLQSAKIWIAAAVLVVLVAGWFYFHQSSSRSLHTIVNNTGRIDSLRLPDGSCVILNKNAAISFDSSRRQSFYAEVSKGEVFFDMGRNTVCTILVPGGFQLKTKAAAFHVHASANGSKVFVTRGKLGIAGKERDTMMLSAYMQGTLEHRKTPARKKLVSQSPLAWRTGERVFRNVPAAEILDAVCSIYGIQITVPPSAESRCEKKLTINLHKKTEKETISLLQQSLSAHLVKDSTDVYYLTVK